MQMNNNEEYEELVGDGQPTALIETCEFESCLQLAICNDNYSTVLGL